MTGYSKDIEIKEYFGLVRRVAYHLKASLPHKFEVDDLIQTGMIGLVDAHSSFSVEQGVPFEAYARLKIRGAIIDSVRKSGDHSRGYSKQSKAIYAAVREFQDIYGREPTESELADKLGITLDKLQKFYQEANSMRFLTIDEDVELESDFQDLDKEILIQQLKPAFELLTEKELQVVSLYYVDEMNLREMKEILDVSEPRLHQIKGKALAKLKGYLLNKNKAGK